MKRRAPLLFLAMCLIWGIPYLFIRIAVGELSPFVLVFARTSIGMLILLPIALSRGAMRGLARYWSPLLARPYAAPAVAAVLGVIVLQERFIAGMAAGFVLVVFGSILATRRRSTRSIDS
jgi:drug/metabolite transporter (DMT)-like permease